MPIRSENITSETANTNTSLKEITTQRCPNISANTKTVHLEGNEANGSAINTIKVARL